MSGVGGAVGGRVGALVGMGRPEYEPKRYEGRVKDGGVLLSVHCDTSDEIGRAKDILKRTGADDIASAKRLSGRRHRATPTACKYGTGRPCRGRPAVLFQSFRPGGTRPTRCS